MSAQRCSARATSFLAAKIAIVPVQSVPGVRPPAFALARGRPVRWRPAKPCLPITTAVRRGPSEHADDTPRGPKSRQHGAFMWCWRAFSLLVGCVQG